MITINREQGLFVIKQSYGYSCLGFDVCIKWANALAEELCEPTLAIKENRTDDELMETYNYYQSLLEKARTRNQQTGWRSKSQLHPQLIGMEGYRVEVVNADGETYRFNVGKSAGFIPCHLQIHNRRSHGGPSVDSRPFRSVRRIL